MPDLPLRDRLFDSFDINQICDQKLRNMQSFSTPAPTQTPCNHAAVAWPNGITNAPDDKLITLRLKPYPLELGLWLPSALQVLADLASKQKVGVLHAFVNADVVSSLSPPTSAVNDESSTVDVVTGITE